MISSPWLRRAFLFSGYAALRSVLFTGVALILVREAFVLRHPVLATPGGLAIQATAQKTIVYAAISTLFITAYGTYCLTASARLLLAAG